ncbi:type VI secretion system membrane subunit TssM [Ensifer adhaerens]
MNRVYLQLLKFLSSRASIVFLGGALAVLGGLAIWQFPSLAIKSLSSTWTWIAVSLGIPSGYLLIYAIRDSATYWLNARVVRTISDTAQSVIGARAEGSQAASGKPDMALTNVQRLSASFNDAVLILKKRRKDKGGRLQLPLYLLIGPSGSGKTTAIMNSGLNFPVSDRSNATGSPALPGGRDVRWFFTDDGVFLDSAGRLCEQPSQENSTVWQALLGLLKRHRRRQQLSGLLVLLGMDNMISGSEIARLNQASLIRERVIDAYNSTGKRLPVYVIFTKADLVAGFTEFFDDLGKEARNSVFGVTFPFSKNFVPAHSEDLDVMETFPGEFDALIGSLRNRLLERVQHEADVARRALIFNFPQQLMGLKDAISGFLNEAFMPNSFDDPIILRGVYFASAMQAGQPLDTVRGALAREFDLALPPSPTVRSGQSGYFLGRLLRDVICKEAWIAEADRPLTNSKRYVRYIAIACVCVAAVAAGAGLIADYYEQTDLQAQAQATATRVRHAAQPLHLDTVTGSDFRPVLPLLDELRQLKQDSEKAVRIWSVVEPVSLTRAVSLEPEAVVAYRNALHSILLPRLIKRLEGQLASRDNDAGFLYPALHIYLMLGANGTVAPGLIEEWFNADWASAFPKEDDRSVRESLLGHLKELLKTELPRTDLDERVISQSRDFLRKTPVAERVLNNIISSPEAQRLPVWDVSQESGPASLEILQLRSGADLSSRIPGIYTRSGFFQVYLPVLRRETELAVRRAWILESPGKTKPDASEVQRTIRKVELDTTGLYLQQYSLQWDRLLNDIEVKPIASVDDALKTLNVISAPTSPIRLLVAAVAGEVTLTEPVRPPEAVSSRSESPLQAEPISSLFPNQDVDDGPAQIAAKHTGKHFKAVIDLVTIPPNSGPNAQAPIDSAIRELEDLYRSLTAAPGNKVSSADRALPDTLVLQRLPASAATLPDPIKQWVVSVVSDMSSLSMGDTRVKLGERWLDGPGKTCIAATTGRYPFDKRAVQDIPLSDFGRLFSTHGIAHGFFTQNVTPLLEANQLAGTASFAEETLRQRDLVASIQNTMFKIGDTEPSMQFDISVSEIDGRLSRVVFDLHGQKLDTSKGSSQRVNWPNNGGREEATITLFPKGPRTFFGLSNAAPIETKIKGAWAVVRLLEQASRRPLSRDSFEANMNLHGYSVTVKVTGDRLVDYLQEDPLSRFRCSVGF